jgi:hypothetical protein
VGGGGGGGGGEGGGGGGGGGGRRRRRRRSRRGEGGGGDRRKKEGGGGRGRGEGGRDLLKLLALRLHRHKKVLFFIAMHSRRKKEGNLEKILCVTLCVFAAEQCPH